MKKILSLILALSLIISVAPMSFAIKSNEAVPAVDLEFSAKPGMHFNFSAANWKDRSEDFLKADINANDAATIPEFATVNTDPWRIAAAYQVTDYRITSKTPADDASNAKPDALYWQLKTEYTHRHDSKTPNSGIAIGVYINETGVFTPSITYENGTTSCYHSFFLAPRSALAGGEYTPDKYAWLYNSAPAVGAVSGSPTNPSHTNSNLIRIGHVNMYKENDEEPAMETESFAPVTIKEPGWYYLYIFPFRQYTTVPVIKTKMSGSVPMGGDYYMNLYSIDLTPEPEMTADAAFTATEDPDYNSETAPAPTSATVKTLALYGETSANIDTETVTYGSTAAINTVPATVTRDDGTYNFLYWAKGLDNGVGNKHIISTSNEKFSYKPHEGNNFLIAVYEKEGAEKEAAFYDRNGQLLNPVITDNKLPALPAMAGLGDAIGWEQLGTGEVFPAEYDFSTLEGDKVFMAKYNELSENITISINGVSDTYAYGDTVTCESDDANFSYWEKTINGKKQIVSIDKTYTFKAWESCTITAVCNGTVTEADLSRGARKILLSTFSVGENLTAVMAEFIGFDGAKEKGIMFGEKKIAMTTDYAQFTVTNDTSAAVTVTGYAIVDEAGETVKYTDGNISVAGATTAAE